jgi:hypothetical protein
MVNVAALDVHGIVAIVGLAQNNRAVILEAL